MKPGQNRRFLEWAVSLLLAFLLSAVCISHLERRFFPVFQTLISAEISGEVTAQVNNALSDQLGRGVTYSDLVQLERDASGQVTAITTNISEINRLRGEAVSETAALLSALEPEQFSVPIGSLTNWSLLSGRGMRITVRGITAGTVTAEFRQDFSAAGLNQTRHQILLHITAPVTILLSGQVWTETVETELLMGETVLVGNVPETYLQISNDKEGQQ